jgi:phosphatidate cytidylyltransferase
VSNQLQRILAAAIAIPLALAAVWRGGLVLVLLVTAVAVLGTRELYRLAERTGIRPLVPLGLVLVGLAPVLIWIWTGPVGGALDPVASFVAAAFSPLWLWAPWPLSGVLMLLVVLAGVLIRRAPDQRPLASAGVTLLGIVYTGLLPGALLLIRFEAGPDRSWAATWLVFFPLVVTWLCDSFAMWGGQAFGRTRLWPQVSPGKTRAGGVAGLVGGVGGALIYVPLVLAPAGRAFSLGQAALMGLVIAVAAQVGDLVESLFKREAGVKDSSGLIPGHGGVLDRFDSLYFVLPVTLVLYRAFGIL